MTLLLGILLGALIGLSLGALGGGGSILAVPVLAYVLGESARSATTGSLFIVGVTAVFGVWGHARRGNVRWRAGLGFGAAGIAASYAGTALNRIAAPTVLVLCFAGLMVLSALGMLARNRTRRGEGVPPPRREPVGGGGVAAFRSTGGAAGNSAGGAAGNLTAVAQAAALAAPSRGLTFAKVIAAGLAVGFLTGFLGVGGGFIIVPALVALLAYPMPAAVGTSLLIIAVNSATALTVRAGQGTFHWSVILPLTGAAVLGSLAGRRLTDRVSGTALSRAFALLVLAVAAYLLIRAATGTA
ncbi:sulfite exporter TauE/SafE family protein [Streptomyces sp. H27-D2]|uniref:sulfite exporter TauE/SafE family protein n=1 Tax=Streptomyces sp. H27-D2 TaxID=3046304 RepID=UPI002DBCCACB|nr:sulfite exporter TauE/SafE family protein [Streptomyces sp. H27-D2]MEC4015276.1 sulfite exporter TauE/SafE family protein [Streptomyces sp. H27-D2]